jgi:hypothetical protein
MDFNFEKDKYYLMDRWVQGRKFVIHVISINSNSTMTWCFTENSNDNLITDFTDFAKECTLIKEGFNSPEEIKDKYPEHFI